MAHYAKVNNGIVEQVIVAEAEYFDTLVDTSPGEWIQTSYNTHGGVHSDGGTPLRGNYAGIGFTYDSTNDVFYESKPYPSWTLNESTWLWEAPTAYPDDNQEYYWNESDQSWDAV
jgi:hypothetical protein|tara:strand:- start:22 stop:366 length:345 start_codon:yes stop_codon:yes gene_type:complete